MSSLAPVPTFGDARLSSERHLAAARTLGLLVAALGIVVLTGWALDSLILKTLTTGQVMKANTALCLFLAGISLGLVSAGSAARVAGYVCAALVIAIAIVSLAEYGVGRDLGIDQLLFDDPVSVLTPRGRMAPATAAVFTLLGVSLVFLHARILKGVVTALALITAAGMLIVATSHWYGATAVYSVGWFSWVAAHTAVGALGLCAGLLLAMPDYGLVAQFRLDTAAGTMARRLLPAAVLAPLILGWLRLQGQRMGLYGTEFGLAMMVSATVITLVGVMWWTVRSLGTAEIAHHVSEEGRQYNYSLLTAVIEGTSDAVFVKDRAGKYVLVNQAATAILGEPPEQIIGKDDTTFHSPAEAQASRERDELVASTGKSHTAEHKVQVGKPRVLLTTVSPWRGAGGDILGVIGISRDITERKGLEAQFLQAQKMEALGRLAGGVAHDFNNLLTAVMGCADLLRDEAPEGTPRILAEEIVKASERAAALTRQLLSFSRKQVARPQVIDINTAIGNLEKMLRRLIGEDITIVMRLNDEGRVLIDAGQFEQILMNLVVNARDAMPEGGRIFLTTERMDLQEPLLGRNEGLAPGPYVTLSVTDTGTGIPPELRAQIFEPFFTTKERGKGTGLGLSTVFGIVESCGGQINVYSEVGTGTTFKIYLPLTEESATAQPAQTQVQTITGTEKILLVEDDTGVRRLVADVLQKLGYRVSEAGGGAEAGPLGQRERPDLLLTDVMLPDIAGPALAELLQRDQLDLKVLYMSGYTSDAFSDPVLLRKARMLQKPFTARALALAVREALDEGVALTRSESG